jgi:hypothetical protein
MAKTNENPLAGFDILSDFLVGENKSKKDIATESGGEAFQNIEPEDLEKKLSGDDGKSKKEPVIEDKKKEDKKTVVEEELEDPADNKKKNDTKKKEPEPEEDTRSAEDKEYEAEISNFFGKELVTKLGIDLDEEDLKLTKIEDVLDLMSQIVSENSKPTYASPEVEAYDEFVKNGGTLREFYDEIHSGRVDISKVNLEDEFDQKSIVREDLLNRGYKEDRIKKMVERYAEAETLKEEAEDALESLKEFNAKKAETLLREKENERKEFEKQQQNFYRDVNDTIKTISNIGGFPVSEKEKRELIQYAFVPEKDGLTKYQKEYGSNVLNIIESAFFAKNRGKLVEDAKKKGSTDAYKSLRDKLKAKGKVDEDNPKGKLSSSSLGDFGRGIIF